MKDKLGDRMKMYETTSSRERALPFLPTCVRLDGKGFHNFCKGLNRPFDMGMIKLMKFVTQKLVAESNACIGYTQSDEITLIMYTDNPKSQIYFDGKMQKITSVLASFATYYFNRFVEQWIPTKTGIPALFDCRVWQVPIEEVANVLIWREQDAVRNSISMAAHAVYGHKRCMNKTSNEKQEMLFDAGINWNEYPTHFKRGTYFQRQELERPFKLEEIMSLPLEHDARSDPFLLVKRNDVMEINIPPLTKIDNKTEFILKGEKPIYIWQ